MWKPEGKITPGMPWCRQEDDIKTGLQDVGWEYEVH